MDRHFQVVAGTLLQQGGPLLNVTLAVAPADMPGVTQYSGLQGARDQPPKFLDSSLRQSGEDSRPVIRLPGDAMLLAKDKKSKRGLN